MTQIAQFMWVGPAISPVEQLCFRSFLATGYEVHLYAYEALANLPPGVQVKDATEIIPQADVFLRPSETGGSYAPFADRFRYHLLYQKGGWWFDTDHIALRLFDEPVDLYIATQLDGPLGEFPTNSALWAPPGDPRIGWARDRCDELLSSGEKLAYTRLGPLLASELVTEFGLKSNLAPWWEFNPYHFYQIDRILFQSNVEWVKDLAKNFVHRLRQAKDDNYQASYVRPGTRAIHVYNEMWRALGYDKSKIYHTKSPYGRLQRKFGIA